MKLNHPKNLKNFPFHKSEEEWKNILSPVQYKIARQKGTERPFTGEYNEWKKKGKFHCVCCGEALFDSENKYNSGSGWPSYWQPISDTSIAIEEDISHGMVRTEVLCSNCGAHLGHVFPDGPPPTGLRYCINSVSLEFRE
jgi:peptide-methionine (R)-S-oxide reductase